MTANNHVSGKSIPDAQYPQPAFEPHCKRAGSASVDSVTRDTTPAPRSFSHDHAHTIFDKGSAANGVANPSAFAYDAGMLLNPLNQVNRQASYSNGNSRVPTPTNLLHASNSSTSLDFHFSSPNDGTISSVSTPPSFDPDPPSYSYASTPAYGFGNMIERANNVEDRSVVRPPKRRKVEPLDGTLSQQKFGGSGSGGTMGQYVKEKREEASKSDAGVHLVEIVDDDSEVEEVADVKEQEVCFGLIEGAKLQCHIVPRPKPGTISLMEGMTPAVKIVLNRKTGDGTNVIHAWDYTREVVGHVDSSTASGLVPLLDSRLSLRTDCRIPSRPNDRTTPGAEISKLFSLELILYGPRKSGKAVAKYLNSRSLRLRHPPRVDAGVHYENPQAMDMARFNPPPVAKPQHAPTYSYQVMPASRTVEEIRSEVMGVFDSLTESEDLPQMEPDACIQTELLKHQKQGLYFMTTKEKPRQLRDDGATQNSPWQVRVGNYGRRMYCNVVTGQRQSNPPEETLGGILADMMGLGKTLSMLSLVTTSLGEAETWSKQDPVQAPRTDSTTKKNGNGFNVPAPEPLGLTKVKYNSRATLLVCPLSTIANWEEQIKAHIKPGTFSYYIYHGPSRKKDPKELAQYDMIITTYNTASGDLNAHKNKKAALPLEEIGWFRIILDEAHMIREQKTLMFKALARLQANRRWAVTGTPVQNRLDDLAALLAFIRLKPFDDKNKFTQYIVTPFKVCDPEVVPKLRILVDSVTLRRLKDKIDLPKRTDQIVRLHFSPQEDRLYKLFEANARDKVQAMSQGRDKLAGGKTYIHILQSILRLRLISAHGRDLLSEEDLQLVQGMTQDSAIDLDSDDDNEAGKQAAEETRAYRNFHLMQETNADTCYLCQKVLGSDASTETEREDNIIGYISTCCHLFCPTCKPRWDQEAGSQGSGTCPLCQHQTRFALTKLRKEKVEVEHESHSRPGNKPKSINASSYSGPHTKTQALVKDLLESKRLSEQHPDELPYKSVVFSAWTSHLDLIQMALDTCGITYTRLDGKMSRLARTNSMEKFREDRSVQVILVSIMAGGLGLNLTAANNVYVMEPQYNPAAEAQAIDRVHRLGQKREVRTVRYIMESSIEEKMLELQDKKTKLASLSMDRNKVMDKTEAAKQKLQDLRSLFK